VPILSTERVALMHLYLRPEARGMLLKFLPWILGEAMALLPGYHLGVFSSRDTHRVAMRKLLGPLGFGEHTLFMR
jgi:hypothetical protein